MGIQHLNRYMKEKCNADSSNTGAIRHISFNDLRGKKIAVDTSIYMYKFSAEGALIDNMYQMIALFRMNGIIPYFVFDGKPPQQKYELLKIRKEEKIIAEEKFKQLNEKLADITDYDEKREINGELDSLRRKFVKLSTDDIEKVKKLMELCGVSYCVANGEADKLCARLVLTKTVYACLSEDMDLFVYGCPRVLRYISLLKSSFVMYDFKKILECLQINMENFRKICVISGTDYNYTETKSKNINLYKTITYYKKFIESKDSEMDFYDWLRENTNYIDDYDGLKDIHSMFNLCETSINEISINEMDISEFNLCETNICETNICEINKQGIINKSVFREPLRKFLDDYNFIFVD
jgi:5'-3' exonuclease